MKRTIPLLAALALAGCTTVGPTAVEWVARANFHGATIDGNVTREEAPAYIKASVDVGIDRIPSRYVAYVIVACNLVDDGTVVVDLPPEAVALCEQLQASVPAPA